MSSYNYQAPNLASILNTLASLAPQQQPQTQTQDQIQEQNQTQPQVQAQTQPPAPPRNDDQFQQIWQEQLNRASQGPQHSAPVANTLPRTIDPATIVEWSAGLRCVMKTVAKHENIINDIRRMIKVQHEHEEQWWKGREALIEKQEARKEGQKKLEEVLKAVGGAISTAPANNGPAELARELETFDMKVYKAQMQMTREMSAKLRNLGVPFFGTQTELVRPAIKDGVHGGGDSKDKEKGVIDEIELVKLQRKMIAFLEDLCSD